MSTERDQGNGAADRPVLLEPGAPADAAGADEVDVRDRGGRGLGFDAFYGMHRDDIGRALAFTLGSTSLAEEAVDEAMARAFQRWSTVGSYENPAGWVYRVGLNWSRSWKRSAFRRLRREEKAAQFVAATTPEPAAGESSDLFDALDTLSIDHRSVVVLRHYCDWSVSETATALDISEGTVKSRSARALAQLRVVLKEEVS